MVQIMVELNHKNPNLYKTASNMLQNGEILSIYIDDKSASIVRRARVLHYKYYNGRKYGKNDRCLLAKFGWYAIRTPQLWGVLNLADITNAKISTEECAQGFFIIIEPI
jgi:hypothetical protein